MNFAAKTAERLSPIINFFKKYTLLLSLLLCASVFFVYFSINGFRIISGNDDYCVYKLIYYGDTAIGCMGFFFTSFISLIQPLFGKLNSYMIIQELLCLSSMLAVNYAVLSKVKGKTGFFLTVVFDIVYFSFIGQEILFTYTSVAACTAGMVLLIFGSLFESRRRFCILQEIFGFILILTGSQVRFPPLRSLIAITAGTAAAVLIVSFIKNRKGRGAKGALKKTVKKYLKTGILIAAAAVIAFTADSVSGALKHTVKGYDELSEYNSAVASVIDYNTAPYFSNKDFFKSIGINSASDVNMLKKWFIDEDFFTAEKLRAISDYSKENINDGIAKKGIVSFVVEPISKTLSASVEDGTIIIYAIFIMVAVFAIIIAALLSPKKRASVIRLSLFMLLWLFYLLVASGIKEKNILCVPIIFLTFFVAFKYDWMQFIVTMSLSLMTVALYFYLMTLRLWFHVSFAVFFPIFVLMILTVNGKNEVKPSLKNLSLKISAGVLAAILLAFSTVTGVYVFKQYPYIVNSDSNPALGKYIDEHPENVFYFNQTGFIKYYFNPIVMPDEKLNVANYGLWVGKSSYMQSTRERNGIKHMFKDSIDSNVRIPLYEKTDGPMILSTMTSDLQDYYNEHYAEEGRQIKLERETRVGGYSIYKVVSQEKEEEKQE